MNLATQEYAKKQIKGEITPITRAVLKKFNRSDSTWIAKGWRYTVKGLRNSRLSFARPNKTYGIQWLGEVFPEAVARILAGEEFTIDSFQDLEYYKYLVAQLNPVCHEPGYKWSKAVAHNWKKKFCDLVRLCNSIKRDGLAAPLDMFMDGEHPVLIRGYRRLEILYQLGVKTVPVRIWRNEWLSKRFIPRATWQLPGDGVHGAAVRQFIKYGHKATDKYWVHGYTPYYDAHLDSRKKDPIKILELGVKTGMSLKVWKEAFPRAEITGLDLKRQCKDEDRIMIYEGDERDKNVLDAVAKARGPFDMIVDDALHQPTPQRRSFKRLWDHLAPGGIYVIEDLHPNYRDKYTKRGDSVMPTLVEKIDHIWTDHTVKSVAFYPNICFVEKA